MTRAVPTERSATGAARLVRAAASSPGDPAEFHALLADTVRTLTGARAVALLRPGAPAPDGARDVDLLGMCPALSAAMPTPAWLEQAAAMAARVARSGAWESAGSIVVAPMDSLVGAVVLAPDGVADPRAVAETITLAGASLALFEARRVLEVERSDSLASRAALRVVAAAGAQDRFHAIATALCDEVCAAWNAERVSLGLLDSRFVRLESVSHTDKPVRSTELSRAVEAAMDECLDQDEDIDAGAEGPPAGAVFIARQTIELARRQPGVWVSSLPVRLRGAPVGVLVVERRTDRPLSAPERDGARLTLDLLAPRLIESKRRDRWIGARAADELRGWGAWVVGPRHTWAKLGSAAVFALIAGSLLLHGTDRAVAPALLLAQDLRVVPAPFDGTLAEAPARPGDAVDAGRTVLARLETSELALQLAEAAAARAAAERRAAIARSEGKAADALIAEASAREAGAREDLLRARTESARILAPISGVITRGDLRERVGGAVRLGEPLFEIAAGAALRVQVHIPEDRIADLGVGARGTLSTTARPDADAAITIVSIDPAATESDGRTGFRAEARLDSEADQTWMRPGMEGVARLDVARRPYAWIWTRRTVNWLRMALWL
ncbi:MAG TPA: hypothetical protein DEB06_08260 [Phycisphaerales bacterium]|nr:hypothetical protein [Phycisphaerales bacterium]